MQKRYIIAIDEGTTGVRVVLFDTKLNQIINTYYEQFKQYFPRPGWVEHDAEEIWEKAKKMLDKICEPLDARQIYGVAITNQRETVVAWDNKTQKPIYHAIVWQCRRTARWVKNNLGGVKERNIHKLTGLIPDAYFSATKIKWIFERVHATKSLLQKGDLRVGTIDCWLAYKLTNGKAFVTDPSNASRTMLYNIHTNQWDDYLLKLFGVPKQILPKVVDNDKIVGQTIIKGVEVPVAGMVGDQQSSLFGQACFEHGDIKNTCGTGSFMLFNLGNKAILSKHKLLTTVAWRRNGQTTYALEGSVFNSGSCVTWLKDEMKFFNAPAKSEPFAEKVSSSDGVFFVPALTGLGAPYWDSDARGMLVGITRGTNQHHVTRAVLESIAFSVKDIYDLMIKETGMPSRNIRFDGGVSDNGLVMQMQADLFNQKIDKSEQKESTAMGAIFMCGLATGAWSNLDEVGQVYAVSKTYSPSDDKEELTYKYKQWKKYVQLALTNKRR